ncbi:MAG: cytochrome c3 family protein [Candidatus Glassbacteria bacterium]
MKLKPFIYLMFLTFAVAVAQAAAQEVQCVKCHSRLMKRYATPARLYDRDVHSVVGLVCSDCHGGDPAKPTRHDRKNPAEGFIGTPRPAEVPGFCNRCHGNADYMRSYNPSLPVDQLEKYRTSKHGQLLLEQGDEKVATCTSCHSVHDIRRVNEPGAPVYPLNVAATCGRCHSDAEYMAPYGIPTDQYAQYAGSVHGQALLQRGDLAAPVCNDCHSNHGAQPVEVSHISQVCGMCHVNNEKLYRESFHSQIFEDLNSPACETCHGNHGIARPDESMLGLGDKSACGACHPQEADDPGFSVSLAMKSSMDSLTGALTVTAELVRQAEQQGMETSELEISLREMRQSHIQARTMVHTFDSTQVASTVKPGLELGVKIDDGARSLLAEHDRRRWWLAGATSVLLLVIAGLYLKLKEVES